MGRGPSAESKLLQTSTATPPIGILYPPRGQRPGEPPVYAVGRLRRLDGSKGLLIHVVQTDATTLEVRHRRSEPDGPYVVVGTLQNGVGWLDLNADDEKDPWEEWVEIRHRRHHEGWKIFQAVRKRAR